MCLAVPGRLAEIMSDDPVFREGRVDFGGVQRSVSLACVPEAEVGHYVLVHAGLAIGVIDESEAQQILADLAQLGAAGSEG
ncbi:MAG: HypC/HybG/HupF family hydrogenase formation chaperone [Pseudomonadota bacterium]|nr:HypC/HybG/HupF family hydrogenase formation chaperone [Pseudomonadota bacterium]